MEDLKVDTLQCEDPFQPSDVQYLHGLRGLYAIQVFLFSFLQVFAPDLLPTNSPSDGKTVGLKIIGIFFHPHLIASSFILLSARTLCLPFLSNPTSNQLASSLFNRSSRLIIPLGVIVIVTALINNNTNMIQTIIAYKQKSNNDVLPVPYRIPSAIAVFNSIFDIFWNVRNYESQAANRAFYSATLWPVSVIYTQSFTVYAAMICIPFTRFAWRARTALLFILTAWWVQSWAWFSITGLLLADAVTQGVFVHEGDNIFRFRVPFIKHKQRKVYFHFPMWLPSIFVLILGFALHLVQTVFVPATLEGELKAHASLGKKDDMVAQPQARAGIFFFILGTHLLVETVSGLRRVLASRILVSIGKRSLSKLFPPSIPRRPSHMDKSAMNQVASMLVLLTSPSSTQEDSFSLVEATKE